MLGKLIFLAAVVTVCLAHQLTIAGEIVETPPIFLKQRNGTRRPNRPAIRRPCVDGTCASTKRQRHRSRFLDRMFANYDKRLFPTNKTVLIHASLFINSLDSISEVSFDFELGIFLRLSWYDQRLAFDPALLDGDETCDMATAVHDQIWLPDIYITNEKTAAFHEVTANRLIKIDNDGRVFYSCRIYATIHCQMELHTFPFDQQNCEINFESYAYTEQHIVLAWADEPLEMAPNLLIPQFGIKRINFEEITRSSSRGNVSSLVITFHFMRDTGFYLLQIYLPSFLIVLTAFTAFWIDPHAVPARVTISVFTTLIIAQMNFSLRKQLPLVSYIKAIDVWILACMFFVFLALIEYCICNVLLRQKPKGAFLMAIFAPALASTPGLSMADFQRNLVPSSAAKSPTTHESKVIDFSEGEHHENIRDAPRINKSMVIHRRRHALVTVTISNSSSKELSRRSVSSAGARQSVSFASATNPPPPLLVNNNLPDPNNSKDAESAGEENDEETDNNAEDETDSSQNRKLTFCEFLHRALYLTIPYLRQFAHLGGVERAEVLEAACRRVFPLSFFLFNVIYLFLYCYVLQRDLPAA